MQRLLADHKNTISFLSSNRSKMAQPDFSIQVERPPESENEENVKPKILPKEETVRQVINVPVEEQTESMPNRVHSIDSVPPETIEIAKYSRSIFSRIEAYPKDSSKQHHFRFKHKSDEIRLGQIWKEVDPNITVDLEQPGKVDVTLMRENQPIGKMQFIHFNRNDRKTRSKHYVNIYLYQFQDSTLFETAKQTMRTFFKELSQKSIHRTTRRSIKKSLKHHTRKQTHRTMSHHK
jgi:hypothetical protein